MSPALRTVTMHTESGDVSHVYKQYIYRLQSARHRISYFRPDTYDNSHGSVSERVRPAAFQLCTADRVYWYVIDIELKDVGDAVQRVSEDI